MDGVKNTANPHRADSRPRVGIATRCRRFIRWHRRSVAATLAALAVLCLGAALSPANAATVPVVVTARDVGPGSVLQPSDVSVAQFPPELVPVGAYRQPDDVAGRIVASGLSQGSPLSGASLIGDATKRPGELLIPIRLPDSAAESVVQVGSQINIYAARPDGETALVASRVRVASLPQEPTDSLTSSSQTGLVIVVAATPDQAQSLAALAVGAAVSIALV